MTDEYSMLGVKYRPAYDRDGDKLGRETPATLDTAGETALASAKTAIAKYDPNGTALKFAFITDQHRSENGVYAGSTVDDRYTLRLASRLCDDVDFDAVFIGGDITNARDENADYFVENMGDVVADLEDLLPYTNVFANVGNHDKRYSLNRANNTNEWLKGLWGNIQSNGNGVDFHYIDYTNFYIDFTRHKIRVIFINQYDAVDLDSNWYANENLTSDNGIHTHGTTAWKDALSITDDDEWLVGVVYHGADNSSPSNPKFENFNYTDLHDTLQSYVSGGGKGIIGAFAGHWHLANFTTIQPGLNISHVSRAYATESQYGTQSAYCLSVFVIDSETGIYHEIRVGRSYEEIPYCAYCGASDNGGLLQNGSNEYPVPFVVYGGNHVRFDMRDNHYCEGINFTDLSKNVISNVRGDKVSGDTSNVLFSAEAGDVIKTEIIFSEDSGTGRKFKIFSPQISDMVSANPYVIGETYTKEVTLAEDTDITAIGMYWYGNTGATSREVLDFELNVYKNGVKLIRS